VFGPISIKKLKDEDKYERNIENYMPSASVVFLDEIWKSSSAIQNALLTIINEKVYRNGEEEIKVNIKGLITASNELPPAAESFDPLWDRFLVRYNIGGIRKHKNFLRMITDTKDVYDMEVPEEVKLSNALLQEWSAAIDEIEVPEEVLNTIQIIRMKIEEYNEKHTGRDSLVMTYDRRWKKIIRLLRTAAFLNERNQVDLLPDGSLPLE
jgi:MoxR-like ATPase